MRTIPAGFSCAIALVPLVGACGDHQCKRRLGAWDACCETIEAATQAALNTDRGDVLVYECGPDHAKIETLFVLGLAGQWEYYDRRSGALVGALEWSDTPLSCGIGSAISVVYGNPPDCESTCVMAADCASDSCLEFVEAMDSCPTDAGGQVE
jgi:hypothetical protein